VAQLMSREEKERLRTLFNSVDTDGDGLIDVHELRELLVKCGVDKTLAAKEAITIIEQTAKGRTEIQFEEFTKVWQRRLLATNDDYIRSIFEALDTKGDGKIVAEELKLVCGDDEDTARRYIDEVGENGYLNLSLFIKAMKEVLPSREGSMNPMDVDDALSRTTSTNVGYLPMKIESRDTVRTPKKPNVADALVTNSTVGVSNIDNRPVVMRSRSLVRMADVNNLTVAVHRARSYSPGSRCPLGDRDLKMLQQGER